MADDKAKSDKPAAGGSDPFVEIVWTILAILLLVTAINSISAFLSQSKFFSKGWKSLTPQGLLASTTKPISSLINPIGAKFIVTSSNADIYNTPGGEKISTKKLGDKGVIVGGPVNYNGQKYWQVKFDDGTTGWVNEKDIGAIVQKITPMSEMETLIGTQVETNKEAKVYSRPGEDEITTVPKGSKAIIIEGPLIVDGVKYWHVRFDDGTEGWVDEDALDSLSGEREPLSKKPSLIGGNVETSKDGTKIYDSPGGNVVGTKEKGVSGKIIEGPLVVDGVKYWHVRFDDGTEGWVSENDLVYVEQDNSGIILSIVKFLSNLFSFTKFLLVVVSLGLIFWIVYLLNGINRLASEQNKLLYPNGSVSELPNTEVGNPRWERVLSHTISQNENDWRLAIMEADIMLGDLLETMSLPGNTIGDKLKAIEKSDFLTLDNAWEAHKVRNLIAHEGMNHKITQKEVNRVIDLYKSVFDEFKII
jgi:SH3-like domain-containing protein